MLLTDRWCAWSLVFVFAMIQHLTTLDCCVSERTSHPDVPTKAAICAAVLPTELTTSVSAPASSIIHVISVFPTATEHKESQHIQEETSQNNHITVSSPNISPVIIASYLTGLQTWALCIHAHVDCSSHLLRVVAATCTCLLYLCRQRAWEGSSHTVDNLHKQFHF